MCLNCSFVVHYSFIYFSSKKGGTMVHHWFVSDPRMTGNRLKKLVLGWWATAKWLLSQECTLDQRLSEKAIEVSRKLLHGRTSHQHSSQITIRNFRSIMFKLLPVTWLAPWWVTTGLRMLFIYQGTNWWHSYVYSWFIEWCNVCIFRFQNQFIGFVLYIVTLISAHWVKFRYLVPNLKFMQNV